jgi:hypothetical protein
MTEVDRRSLLMGLAATGALASIQPAHADTLDRHALFVFSNPLTGRDAEFNGWYDTRHIPDVLDVPGFVAAQRFVFTEAQIGSPLAFRYAVRFDLETATPAASVHELGNRLRSGVAKRGPAFDYTAFQNYLVHEHRPLVTKAQLYPNAPAANSSASTNYKLLALSSPVAGQESEYDRWYDKQHTPDLLSIDGVVATHRFWLSDPEFGGQYRRQHMMMFDVETADLKQVYETIRANVRSGKTVPSSSFDGTTYASASLQPLTERIVRR